MVRGNASFYEAVTVALQSLRSSKLRSFLTLLGIILATTTLIAVIAVIHGMDIYVAESLVSMGRDGFRVQRMVMIGEFDPKKWLEMRRRNPEMKREEFEFVKEHATLLKEFGVISFRSGRLQYGKETLDDAQITGGTANMGLISNYKVQVGRFINEVEDSRKLAVAFVGNDIKERFFPSADPINKIIQIDGRPYQVVGVAVARGSAFGQSRDNFVWIPFEVFAKTYGSRSGLSFAGVALNREYLSQAQDEVRMLLRAYRHLKPNLEDNFAIYASDSIVESWDRLTGVIAATAIAVVSVFLVVGGVVIMNIMLAVVTERTHEIGIRKSVGARNSDVLNQFLVESSLLAATGGLIGVVTAWIIAVLVRSLTPVPMAVPVSAVFIAVSLSAAVGLFFGIYPARRAALLDPIDALRYEQ